MKIESKPLEKEFKLKSDPEGIATVTIKQASFGATMKRSEMFAKRREIVTQGSLQTAIEYEWNAREVEARDIGLTLSGAKGFLIDGVELFQFKDVKGISVLDMTETAFITALGKLPDIVVDEIHEYVLDVNPQWGNTPGE